jgi:hypothetical protein
MEETGREPKCCATCGKGHYRRVARAGRYETYKGVRVELPASFALLECDSCGEILMSPKEMEQLAPIFEAAARQ